MIFRKPESVNRLFIAFIIYLPVQYLGVGIVGALMSEPWPAFVLPGFKNVYDTEKRVEIDEPRFYIISNGEDIRISHFELFEGLQASQMQGFIQSNFRKPVQYSKEAKEWLKNRAESVFPDVKVDGIKISWIGMVFDQVDGEVEKHAIDQQEETIIHYE